MQSILTKSQSRKIEVPYQDGYIVAEFRHDDKCGNGHNMTSVTASIYEPHRIPGETYIDRHGKRYWNTAGGCLHDEIVEAFGKTHPEMVALIKWHLCSTDEPMHYVANAVYLAGDRDCWGRAAGEPSNFEHVVYFGNFPLRWTAGRNGDFLRWLIAEGETKPGQADYEVIRIDHANRQGDTFEYGPKFTLGGAPDAWYQCPFDTEQEALEWLEAAMLHGVRFVKRATAWSKGKERELDEARAVAVWPDATDEDLTTPGLAERLKARLPRLLEEHRAAVEAAGFTW